MAREGATNAGFSELVLQARITNRLLAAQLKSALGQQEMVRLLVGTGASAAEIADVLGTTAATVSTTMQRLKKKTKGLEPAEAKRLASGTAEV